MGPVRPEPPGHLVPLGASVPALGPHLGSAQCPVSPGGRAYPSPRGPPRVALEVGGPGCSLPPPSPSSGAGRLCAPLVIRVTLPHPYFWKDRVCKEIQGISH